MKYAIVLALVLIGVGVLPAPARADLRVCNANGQRISVAVAYGFFSSLGWFNIVPGKCTTVLSGDISRDQYYVYAATADGTKRWTGAARDSYCIDWGRRFKYGENHICTTRTVAFRRVARKNPATYTFR